jgi:hypothetical protein
MAALLLDENIALSTRSVLAAAGHDVRHAGHPIAGQFVVCTGDSRRRRSLPTTSDG